MINRKQTRVMLVEDDKQAAMIIARTLTENTDSNCDFRICHSVEQAISEPEKHKIDLILLDLNLSDSLGLSTYRKVRTGYENVPIIILTGMESDEISEQALREGAHDYIVKAEIVDNQRLYRSFNALLTLLSQQRRIMDYQEKLEGLTAHIQKAREEERKSIAREIHDDLGQNLTALKINLSVIKNRITDKKALESLKNSLEITERTIHSVKGIITRLRPWVLDDLGLAAALDWLVSDLSSITDTEFSLVMPENLPDMEENKNMALFRIVQEALTNVIRHAKATSASIQITDKNECLMIRIEDNGVGIDLSRLTSRDSFGLIGMRERTQFLGGTIDINRTDKGTEVLLELPLLEEKLC